MQPELLVRVAESLERPDADIATLACPCQDDDIFSASSVLSVIGTVVLCIFRTYSGWAHFAQGDIAITQGWLRHLGIYAYRVKTFASLQQTDDCFLETTESLEQLRALWLGLNIHVEQTDVAPIRGIDTQEDWEFAQSVLRKA